MHPLTPDDLLIRRSPLELEAGLTEDKSASPVRSVPLERFQTLEHTIRENPLTVEPYLELAGYYLNSTRWTDARRVLENACQRFPEEERARFLLEESQLARSLQLNSQAQLAHRNEPNQLTQATLDQSQLELNALRERVCRERLTRDPQQLQLHLPLASALQGLGQTSAAIESLQLAMQEPKLRSVAAFQLGQLLEESGRIPEALSAYRRAALYRVPLPPRELKLRALRAAADLSESSRLIDSARRYLALLVELEPDNAAIKERHARLCATPL